MMYGFVRRRLVLTQVLPNNCCRPVLQDLDTTVTDVGLCLNLRFYLRNARSLVVGIRSFSNETESVSVKHGKEYSFTVSYLINSCGLSPEIAKSVSEKVKLKSSKQPDSVLRILKNHGFTNTHISKLVKSRPSLLLAHPERSILPKFEFFKSIGVTNAELAGVCSSTPAILSRSLEHLLIPNYKFLKSVLLYDEKVVKAFRKKSWIFHQDTQKRASPKFAILRELGVPESFFPLILSCYSSIVLQRSDQFDENVKKAIGMGFNPERCRFIHAVHSFTCNSQTTWESKLDVFKRCGWSDDEFSLAFRRCPNFMNASENKLVTTMDFLVNKMGWKTRDIVTYPDILLVNLEKRIIPRCLVIKVLQSKGLVKENMSLRPIIKLIEKKFLDKFVTKYNDTVPQLLNIYQRKKGLEALNMNSYSFPSN
ncbi:hypothetical protein Dsin_025333 [Dipteronia sinensis]|uniref:Uncharacterized protein n=1 Tax=Dipteronia sinensis TaxID=43782 RepID=A0AAD9ZX48_9ROSI|nr:hypothetical protein Dsin_025333 [Dipteronia sinensis]